MKTIDDPIKVVSLAISKKKGTRKDTVESVRLVEDHGIDGDAHAGDWHRQVSLLSSESIDGSRSSGLDVTFGDFAENVATVGIDWKTSNRLRSCCWRCHVSLSNILIAAICGKL